MPLSPTFLTPLALIRLEGLAGSLKPTTFLTQSAQEQLGVLTQASEFRPEQGADHYDRSLDRLRELVQDNRLTAQAGGASLATVLLSVNEWLISARQQQRQTRAPEEGASRQIAGANPSSAGEMGRHLKAKKEKDENHFQKAALLAKQAPSGQGVSRVRPGDLIFLWRFLQNIATEKVLTNVARYKFPDRTELNRSPEKHASFLFECFCDAIQEIVRILAKGMTYEDKSLECEKHAILAWDIAGLASRPEAGAVGETFWGLVKKDRSLDLSIQVLNRANPAGSLSHKPTMVRYWGELLRFLKERSLLREI